MTLYESKKGQSYELTRLFVQESITRRLQALGLNEGTRLAVINRKKRGAIIIRVRGTRLALGKEIAKGIEVKETKDDGKQD